MTLQPDGEAEGAGNLATEIAVTFKSISELGQSLADLTTSPLYFSTFVEAVAVKAAFLAFVKDTNEPESFPGLAHHKPPTKDAKFLLVVDEFDVDPSKRPDGEFIRCAACATRKKFRRGSLAWYPAEGVLRVVGNECGDERRAEAREDYKRRSTLNVLNEFLETQLLELHSTMLRAETLRESARHAQELSLALKTRARSFCDVLAKALKVGDGQLRIIRSEVDEASQEQRVMTIHQPQGAIFLKGSFQPLRRLDEAMLRFKEADRGSTSKARRWLTSHREKLADLDAVYANLKNGLTKLAEVEFLVAEAGRFLSQTNLEGVDDWSRAHGSAVRVQWGSIFITFIGPGKRGEKAEFATLRPNWRLLGVIP